ncbi:Reverse transcriptase zinc-binding domain [Arabidopsis thaliana x Arabidopsis arenosa]|uniref:Reverse transcriptase zinc-binding domain n=1 Tax=Arabidopsis thaliana x Arabidopsis arenosa TaxID=1240361 RepID=A0A8T1YCY0_9BRAS|nr:Reverse transcriptase zinc-binding domain [Arabidopsis thaliana x Arabidopsis arenosa]
MASASASELAISSAGDPDAAMTDICEQDHPPGRCVWVMGAKNYRRERWREETTGDVESSRINVNLPRHFFMVRFELEEEYLAALTNGPWRAFGSHLVVQAWTPEFEPLRDEIVTTPVWVRLSNLPVNFYHRSILMGIARGLGKPIRVDSTTLNLERTRFTRVCVEVNLTKPFKGTVMVNGDRYFVAYEGLSNICSSCGLYGHLVHNCSKLLIEKAKNVVPAGVTDVARGSQPENDGSTVIRRSGRRPEKPDTRIAFTAGEPEADLERNIQEISENITVSNRFGGLEENMVVTEMREATILSRGDKENINQDQENIQRRGKSFDQGSDGTEVSQLIKGPSGPRGNLLPKKALVIKPNGFAGSKPKHKSVTKPTHGLVFGPTRGEIALSESGKRLRVENRAVGRLRGAFVREGDNMQVNRDHSRGDDANANRNQLVLAEEGLQKGSKTSSGLSEEETGMTEARNRIESLKNDAGQWVTSPTDLEKLVVDYYKRLYSMDDLDSEVESLPAAGFRRLLREDLQDLSRLFTAEEVEKAIRSMGQYKAPGPDGFQPGFYQQCWDVVGLAQSSFIPGRLSMDNIVLVQEAVHSMRRKKGRKGWMLLKLDLEKAYDRIRWDFLEDTLKVSGLPEKYVGWIMQCVMGPSMNAKVLRHKYKIGDVKDPRWLVAKGSWSSRWRSVGMGLREVVIPRLSWVLGDGKIIRFWTDKWLLDQPLMDLASQVVTSKEKKIRVKLQLAAMVVDNVTGAVDRVSWGGIGNGQFTVKSAYVFLTRDDSPRQWLGKLFRRVWHVKAPERVQVFLWLVVNQALMTNVERHRRHLCESGLCQVCKAGEDTIIHVLRDCLAMAEIWLRLLPPRKRQSFFTKSILEWVYDNLGVETDIVGSPWSTNFAMAVWWGWKWRCGNVFNTNRKCRDRMRFVKELAKNVSSAFVLAADSGHGPMREERMIAWKPPKSD